MPNSRIQGIKVCVFDAYGTLFDLASATNRCADVLGGKLEGFSRLWREKQLQYTWLRSLEGHHADFWQVTGDALDFTMRTFNMTDASLRSRLLEVYLALDVFPEVPETLRCLRQLGFKAAILSNGTAEMLAKAVAHAKMEDLFDAVLSVEQAGIYKPHPRVYQLAVDYFGVSPSEISFQSSNAWDAYGASAFGMHVVWCNRYQQVPEILPGHPDREIHALDELPALFANERS
jgi:2-haloacid dehalogenase